MNIRQALVSLVLVLAGVVTASGQNVRIEQPSPTLVDVIGESGSSPWRSRYGTWPAQRKPSVVVVSPTRAYFLHGPWLRLIDSTNGNVLGRWRFPGFVENVSANANGSIEVRFAQSPWTREPSATVTFDPSPSSVPPDWDVGALLSYRFAEWEAFQLLKSIAPVDGWTAVIPNAATAIPALEELVARDPDAPFLRLALAKLMSDAGDPRAAQAFANIMNVASTDFTEWFRISAALDGMPVRQTALAEQAYDRAFRDFIRRGRDPRLVEMLIARLIVYSPLTNLLAADDALRQHYLERIYLVAPTGEGTDRAWAYYAELLEQRGDPAAAQWRTRADASARHALLPTMVDAQLRHDQFMLIALGAIPAVLFFIASRQAKYAGQRKMRALAAMRSGQPAGHRFGFTYWSPRERAALLAFAVLGWLALGASWSYARLVLKSASLPVRVGMLHGHDRVEDYHPPSAERDLLQAIGLQSIGRVDEAEQWYRKLPQFAVSWNNLGVLLARAGRTDESAQAFNRALAMDGDLAEAVLNTRGEAISPATQTFQRYAPDMKMTALPDREHFLRAYLGSAWTNRHWRILLGPLDSFRSRGGANYLNNVLMLPAVLAGAFWTIVLALSIALIAIVRRDDVSVGPGRLMRIIEHIVPGTAVSYRWLGVPTQVLWCTVVLAIILHRAMATPYLLIGVVQPGFMRAFGFDVSRFRDLNPSLLLLLGVAIGLSIANLWLVRSKRAISD
jgi:tetratricopeptide (TPR) repeat protein